MLNTDRAYVLIQRKASGSSGRKGKEVRPSKGKLLPDNSRRFWQDVVLLEDLASTEVLDTAKAVIEEIGQPGETYRIISLDAPPTELACKARVTVAEIVPQPPQKPTASDEEEESEAEEPWEDEDP